MATQAEYPTGWLIAKDFDPNDHMMQLKGKDYLSVQYRLLWFIRDQRELIKAGLAKVPYVVQTDLVEMDRDTSWAHFKTYVRDVLGNEATMYGSESAKDFADYAEKASTKSLGRALLALGYGTAAAPEMDEGERVVDSPVERKPAPQPQQQAPRPARPPARAPITAETPITYTENEPTPAVAETVSDLVKISLAKQIGELRAKLRLDTAQWNDVVKRSKSNDEVLANLQQMWEDKQDGFPLDRPAKKAQ